MGKNQPTEKDFRFQSDGLTLSEVDGKRRFSGIAYSGLPIENHNYWGRVVFDLSTTETPTAKLPILLEHDRSKRLGFSSNINVNGSITIDGEMLTNELSKSVVNDADDGFPWQMSVHIVPSDIQEIAIDKPVDVNGQQFSGGFVFRNNKIREVSFTPTGWDDKTSATIFNFTGDQAVSDPKDKEAIESLTQENTDLKASNTTLLAEVVTLKDSVKSIHASQRTADIKTLFSDLGRDYTDDGAKPYMAMDNETFSVVAKDMRDAKPKPGDHMFNDQANGGDGGNEKFSLAGQMKELTGAK